MYSPSYLWSVARSQTAFPFTFNFTRPHKPVPELNVWGVILLVEMICSLTINRTHRQYGVA